MVLVYQDKKYIEYRPCWTCYEEDERREEEGGAVVSLLEEGGVELMLLLLILLIVFIACFRHQIKELRQRGETTMRDTPELPLL